MEDQPDGQDRGFLYARLRWMPAGCLMWILISAACPIIIWIAPLFGPEGEPTGPLGLILFLAACFGILWLIMRLTDHLTGTEDSGPGNGLSGSNDRGAGTMSWYDDDRGGGE